MHLGNNYVIHKDIAVSEDFAFSFLIQSKYVYSGPMAVISIERCCFTTYGIPIIEIIKPSYFYNGNLSTWKEGFCIEMGAAGGSKHGLHMLWYFINIYSSSPSVFHCAGGFSTTYMHNQAKKS